MGFSRKKPDPISDHAKALNQQIEALESEIQRLTSTLAQSQSQPRMRSSIYPHAPPPSAAELGERSAPVFEKVDHGPIHKDAADVTTPEHFNELGVRKFDLIAWWRKLRRHFHQEAPANPKLVHLMAAGTVQGLRPLRIEKRIQRRRFLLLVGVLLALFWGLARLFFRG